MDAHSVESPNSGGAAGPDDRLGEALPGDRLPTSPADPVPAEPAAPPVTSTEPAPPPVTSGEPVLPPSIESESADLVVDDTAHRLRQSVVDVAGVTALAPGLRDLVASATAKVLRRAGGEQMGIDLSRTDAGTKVRIDAHLDDSRPVSAIVDEIFTVVGGELGEPLDVSLRVVSRHHAAPTENA